MANLDTLTKLKMSKTINFCLAKKQMGMIYMLVIVIMMVTAKLLLQGSDDQPNTQNNLKISSAIRTVATHDTVDFKSYNNDSSQAPKLKNSTIKTIATVDTAELKNDFHGCEYSNCDLQYWPSREYILQADVLVFEAKARPPSGFGDIPKDVASNQVWVVYSHESPSYEFNRWHEAYNEFFASMTHERSSDIYLPWKRVTKRSQPLPPFFDMDYSNNKTRGAFAYVSNCDTTVYDRLGAMRELGKHIDIDIFGECTGNIPCSRMNFTCEEELHKQYRFYLAFENSLCKDYITEKFWKTLGYDNYVLPIAIGGLDSLDYIMVAPPDSFIHAYNFTTIDELGKYLKFLIENPDRYNSYHKWRASWQVTDVKPCELCRLANEKTPGKNAGQRFADRFNDEHNCRTWNNAPVTPSSYAGSLVVSSFFEIFLAIAIFYVVV